jgi:hypothetical protein
MTEFVNGTDELILHWVKLSSLDIEHPFTRELNKVVCVGSQWSLDEVDDSFLNGDCKSEERRIGLWIVEVREDLLCDSRANK